MTDQLKSTIFRLSLTANIVGVLAFAAAAATMTIATLLAFGGVLPWLEFKARFGGITYENAGQITQIGLTVLLLLLCVYLPSAHRVLRLENSHRRFCHEHAGRGAGLCCRTCCGPCRRLHHGFGI